jgi:hypothetical protein
MSLYATKPRITHCPVTHAWILNTAGRKHRCSTDTDPCESAWCYFASALAKANAIGGDRRRVALTMARHL